MKYTTKADTSLEELDRKVNNSIKEGWRPLGGVAVMNSGSNGIYGAPLCQYIQAMVKE